MRLKMEITISYLPVLFQPHQRYTLPLPALYPYKIVDQPHRQIPAQAIYKTQRKRERKWDVKVHEKCFHWMIALILHPNEWMNIIIIIYKCLNGLACNSSRQWIHLIFRHNERKTEREGATAWKWEMEKGELLLMFAVAAASANCSRYQGISKGEG